MTIEAKTPSLPPIVPIDDETRAMIDYAASPEGRVKIDRAREEIRAGKGVVADEAYFDAMNRRISKRTASPRKA